VAKPDQLRIIFKACPGGIPVCGTKETVSSCQLLQCNYTLAVCYNQQNAVTH